MLIGALADLVERVDHRLKLDGEFGKYLAHRARARRWAALGERPVSLPAHRDVVVDVDELAREPRGEEPRDEQRNVAQALQASFEALNALTDSVPKARRLEFEANVKRVAQARIALDTWVDAQR